MNSRFYAKLAATNIKKNAQTYIPYILTCTGTIAMYYIAHALTKNPGLDLMSGGSSLRQMLYFGAIIVALFSIILLLYTNRFLMKRRYKEFGLFNVLGMEKRHLAQVMWWETIYVAFISLVVGILGGMLFEKLMFLILLKILRFEVRWGFNISGAAIKSTLILFVAIFSVTLINNLIQIYRSKPIELIKGSQVGEREPKTKWLEVVVGAVCLASGYYIALTTKSPLAAMNMFFIAVILVIVGTYCLFTAGSIWILKLLRKNKRFYYQPNHFISISGMIYRMKQNAVGLANICILSTMVLVTLSTTISLYIGVEDQLRNRYPRDILVSVRDVTTSDVAYVRDIVADTLLGHNLEPENSLDYRYLLFIAKKDEAGFQTDRDVLLGFSPDIQALYFIPGEDYSRITGESISLAEDEILLYSNREAYPYDTLSALGLIFTIKQRIDTFVTDGSEASLIYNSYFVVVKNQQVLEQVYQAQAVAHGEYGSPYIYHMGFDLDTSGDQLIAIYQQIKAALKEQGLSYNIETAELNRDEFYSLYGGLFFLGIFLGTLFIMGTVLIIYYKQITEGYEDKQRFEIMQKVGMSKGEVNTVIRTQVLMVFFLPLIVATIHIAFAFRFITKMLAVFNLANVTLFAWCTVGTILVFAVFYSIVYSLTAKEYYRIVS